MVCVTVKEKKENLVVVPKSERSGIKHMLKTIKNNDQLRWTALVMFLYNLGSNILTGLMMYYVYFTFGYNGSIVSVFSIVSSALAVIIVIYPWLSKRVSRRNMVIGSMAAVTLGYTCMLISGLFWHSGDAYYLMAAFSALSMGGQTIFYMVLTVALQNTIEYNQLKTGKREEGIIFSVRPFMAKMGSAAQMAIVAIIFLALNVTDITKAISEQENLAVANPLGLPPDVIEAQKIANIKDIISGVPESTSTWLLIFMTVLPIILICAGGFIFIKKYKLDEKRYAEILAQLEESDKDCAEKLAEKKLADEEAIPMFEISGTVPPESAISYSRLEADYTRDCGKGNDSVEDGEAEAKDAVQEETGAPDDTDSN
jgi:melibiose permease/lactose/raffinose/galactose permease